MHDVIIAGGGPAGLTAAIYAARSGMSVLVFEKSFCGGQAALVPLIENYSGLINISGYELAQSLEKQALSFGVQIIHEQINEIVLENTAKKVLTPENSYTAKTLILCTGTRVKKLNINGEKKFEGRGVSYCATCDGFFYKDKITAVIGTGEQALEDAVYLSDICKKVYFINKNAADTLKEKVNIEILPNHTPVKIDGEQKVSSLSLMDSESLTPITLELDGVFIAAGSVPENDIYQKLDIKNENGYIITNENMETSIEGIFAAGDARKKRTRQIVTAAADGAEAAISAKKYIMEISK